MHRSARADNFEAELFAVQHAPHDDQVDALVQGLAYSDRPKFGWDKNRLTAWHASRRGAVAPGFTRIKPRRAL